MDGRIVQQDLAEKHAPCSDTEVMMETGCPEQASALSENSRVPSQARNGSAFWKTGGGSMKEQLNTQGSTETSRSLGIADHVRKHLETYKTVFHMQKKNSILNEKNG